MIHGKAVITDVNRSLGDHERAEHGVRRPVAGTRVSDLVSSVVGISRGRFRACETSSYIVLTVPMIVVAGPDYECDIPSVPGGTHRLAGLPQQKHNARVKLKRLYPAI